MAEQATPVLTRRPKTPLMVERRAWLRFPSQQDISCKPSARPREGEAAVVWPGKVRDVSPAGIGLSMSRRFEPGAELIVEISARADQTLSLPVRVVHATPGENGLWIIGCEFDCSLSQEELRRLLEN
jgi:hypothetical protein